MPIASNTFWRAASKVMAHRVGRRFCGVSQRNRAAPNRFKRDGEETEAKCVGDELAARQRDAERGEQPDLHPTKGKQADKGGDTPAPEASGRGVDRNDTEALVMGGQQQMADNDRDADHKKDDEVAEDHLAQQRRPVEGEEGADAAEGKGRHEPDSKGKACGDDPQPVIDGFERVLVEMPADPLRRLAKQPFDAKAQANEYGKQQQALDPSGVSEL